MELCSIGHDQVCYETGYCPACALKDELLKKLDELQEENDKMTDEIQKFRDKLQAKVDSLSV